MCSPPRSWRHSSLPLLHHAVIRRNVPPSTLVVHVQSHCLAYTDGRIRRMRYILSQEARLTALGIGSYCLGGCDPRFSYSIDSCMPAPQCVNKTYTFENISKSLADYNTYLGDANTADWTYSGYPLQYGENLLLTMPANSAGTVIMSTNYLWYGQVSATLKTSRDQGVVTAYM